MPVLKTLLCGVTEPPEKTRNPLSGLGKRSPWLLPVLTQNTPTFTAYSTTLFTTFLRRPLILDGHDSSATIWPQRSLMFGV